jgi:hypothetical protein
MRGIFVIFRNDFLDFLDFYHGTNMDASSPWPGLPVPRMAIISFGFDLDRNLWVV